MSKKQKKPKVATGRIHWAGKIEEKPTGVPKERKVRNK